MKFHHKFNKGQTLLEIVVAFAVVTLILVALISAITVSMANAQYSRNKAQATKYAQEAIEWLRGQRDTFGWNAFYAKDPIHTGTIYCVNNLTSFFPGVTGSCQANDMIMGTIFQRQVTLTGVNNDKVTALITVSWTQGTRQALVNMETVLTKW